MSTHYQTMQKSGFSKAQTAIAAVILTLTVVFLTVAATHIFAHHSSAPAKSLIRQIRWSCPAMARQCCRTLSN